MEYLSREQILAVDDIKSEDVEVPEWGAKVRIRSLMADDRDAWETMVSDEKTPKGRDRHFRARLVALCAVDGTGERLFTDADVLALGRKNANAMDRLVIAALRVNGLTAKAIDELAGNSDAGPAAASSSGLPAS